MFGDSKMSQVKLKRTKCAASIVNVLAPHFSLNLVNDMGNNPYSLILDESTDISEKKLLGVVIRFTNVKQKKVTSTFLELVELKDAISTSIYINEYLYTTESLKTRRSDNASVMTGSKHGVHAELQKRWKKNLILIPCACHLIQLSVSAACKQLPTNIEFLVREIYYWFCHSTVRQNKYIELYASLYSAKSLKITRVCDTRWLSIYPAVTHIID